MCGNEIKKGFQLSLLTYGTTVIATTLKLDQESVNFLLFDIIFFTNSHFEWPQFYWEPQQQRLTREIQNFTFILYTNRVDVTDHFTYFIIYLLSVSLEHILRYFRYYHTYIRLPSLPWCSGLHHTACMPSLFMVVNAAYYKM